MNKNVKTIVLIVCFAILLAISVLAYNRLSERYTPETELAVPEIENSSGTLSGEDTAVSDGGENESGGEDKIKAPDFTVFDADGNKVKLSDMTGTPVVLNFWASWCPPCKSEMPGFEALYKDADGSIAFMMVNLTDGLRETKEKAESYISSQGYTFPVYFDTEKEAAYTYGISSIPTTLLIDRDGYIVAGAQGAISEESLRKGAELLE